MGGTYHMLNISTKCVVLRYGVIWMNETYGKYLLIRQHMKDYYCVLQENHECNKWSDVKIYPVQNENVKTEQDNRGEEYVQDTTKAIYFSKQ